MQLRTVILIITFIQCSRLTDSATIEHSADNVGDDTEVPKHNATREILKASETADPGIVKQIRRLNEDGSYTIGYEADDGTFKIESRDVLGNVKGTFGYIDKDGEIKRVTYSSSSDSTPQTTPATTTTTTTSPVTMIVRMNSTVSSTTRRPSATVVYPRGTHTTRGTVIQPIPKRRPLLGSTTKSTTTNNPDSTTTERQKTREDATTSILNLYQSKTGEDGKSVRTQILKPVPDMMKDDLDKRVSGTMKTPHTVKPVFENTNEKEFEKDVNKANTIRRELSGAVSSNPHMLHLQQSIGDDSTDVYGSHLSLGTVRPLFTTTTPRPRLIPFQSIIAARQKLQQQYQSLPTSSEQETTIEASTGRIFDRENVVTSNPVPVVHIPAQERDNRIFQQQIYRRPPAAVQFRSHEYMRDNPGAPIPIGNQRSFLNVGYQPQHRVFEPQFVKEASHSQLKMETQEPVTMAPYEIRPVTRIVPIPVDDRGVPIPGYQTRFVNPYMPENQPSAPVLLRPRVIEAPVEDMHSIATPVSTRDLRRLLHILLIRQARLQALMDQLVAPGPPYQQLPLFRQAEPHYNEYNSRGVTSDGYQNIVVPRNYPRENERYDYRGYDQQYRSQQQELYTNQISNYEQPQYESQRYVPRRRSPRPYDTTGASTTQVDDTSDYLPPEVREALLLKMLVLAISPDYMPTPAPATELTTAAPPPPRKQVRNVQILGEEGSMEEMKRKMQRH